jgi:hypothetical protein
MVRLFVFVMKHSMDPIVLEYSVKTTITEVFAPCSRKFELRSHNYESKITYPGAMESIRWDISILNNDALLRP